MYEIDLRRRVCVVSRTKSSTGEQHIRLMGVKNIKLLFELLTVSWLMGVKNIKLLFELLTVSSFHLMLVKAQP